MICSHCTSENSPHARACGQCGAPLECLCPACGHAVAAAAKFCSECGAAQGRAGSAAAASSAPETRLSAPIAYTPAHLTERILAEQAALQARAAGTGERKTISVVFADMAGSTALIQGLDPEEVRHLIDPVLGLMMEAVHHYEGYVAKSLGDGILALFGAPIAHEDHPQRALYAALRMQDAMRLYADRLRLAQAIPLQIRVGIHTGEVVVRSIRTDSLHTDYDPVGQTIHIASRMEGIAVPGSIVVSESTYRLTDGYLAFRPLGVTPVKGMSEPQQAFEVLGLGPLRTRLQVAASRGLVPFVGRRAELAQLQRALQQACAGQGQVAGVVGEPGVGKSRLFYEFSLGSKDSCLVLETFSVSHGKAFAYRPLIELLHAYLQLSALDDERRRREVVTGKILTLDRGLEDCLPYLFYLLGLAEANSPLAQMDASLRRSRTFEALWRVLQRESVNQPLQLVFEDLQWLDSETEVFLDFLRERVATARMLLLVNYRPEYRHDWAGCSHYVQLRLEPLAEQETAELLDVLLGPDASLAALKPRLLAQTGGNPFFIEEVVQTLVEEQSLSGSAGQYRLVQTPADLHIPTTVQGVLCARIDRLPADQKTLLQTLAVIGKDFTWSLVNRVVEQTQDQLRRGLARLQAGEFIFQHPAFPDIEYTFKHGLTQQVAYGTLLLQQRRALHERTARVMEVLYEDRLEQHCSELAWHYGHSDNREKAVTYLRRAGYQAAQRSANQEAIAHLERALELMQGLAESAQRDHEELALQIVLGPIYMASLGYAAPEVEASYSRALTLARRLGEAPQLFSVLVGLRRFYNLRGEFRRAQEVGLLLMNQAQSSGDAQLMLEAHAAVGPTCFFMGDYGAARRHLEALCQGYDRRQHAHHAVDYGMDPGVLGHNFMAWVLWFSGQPEAALVRSERMLALAEKVAHPFSLAFALGYSAEMHQLRGEVDRVRKRAEAAVALSVEQGFPYWQAQGRVLLGWVDAREGDVAAAIEEMRAGLTEYRANGAELGCTYLLALLAETLLAAARFDEAQAVLQEARALADSNGERYYLAELHRLAGAIRARRPVAGVAPADEATRAQSDAQACFEQAIVLARQQGALALELRATLGLAGLWQQQGKDEAAGQRLAAVYGRFTEGFDTPDLLAAKALLDALGPGPAPG
ncbi:adenylate/guanylate cyclase domain-containing protein [Marinobacterium rhizophilum]|uniref:AAA family ATPase n=1 Tax=Marinobacterium rhizophilum TaxID=420402 RepID=A0ABY5HQ78_9GAMM|nr:adenylate/guanylate cyclase domain-containing protein [Marinobacterium rhizophilum]UTW13041.1 AAA family ATPase [Marinobacterium rhizophilum]